jgi:hypothetical protein
MPEARLDEPTPLIWRSLPVRLCLIAIPLALTTTVLVFNVGPAIRLIAAATLGISFVSPVHGLLLVATLAPIGRLVAMVIGAGEFRIGEVMVLAFLLGWLLRTRPVRPGPRVAAARPDGCSRPRSSDRSRGSHCSSTPTLASWRHRSIASCTDTSSAPIESGSPTACGCSKDWGLLRRR